MEKVDFKRAKFSGFLDVLGFLAALVMTAGYIVVDLVKVSGLPDGITNFWGKLSDGVEKAFDGVFLGRPSQISGTSLRRPVRGIGAFVFDYVDRFL